MTFAYHAYSASTVKRRGLPRSHRTGCWDTLLFKLLSCRPVFLINLIMCPNVHQENIIFLATRAFDEIEDYA